MTALLGFVLGTAAAMAVVGAVTSAASVFVWPLVAGWSPARRADVAASIAVAPAAAALALGLAVALPSARAALGLRADHCADHLYHGHLCWLHADGLPPAVATVGAVALVTFVARAGGPLLRAHRVGRAAAAARQVARHEAGVTWLAGPTPVCHVVGVLAPRVYVSERLVQDLGPASLAAMLDHERAHVARRDPAVGLAVSVGAAFGLPGLGERWGAAWRQAAEEAADADSASVHGAIPVAEALVAYARVLPAPAPAAGLGFGDRGIEARVRALCDGPIAARSARAVPLVGLIVASALAVGFVRSDGLHHAVEAQLHRVAAP